MKKSCIKSGQQASRRNLPKELSNKKCFNFRLINKLIFWSHFYFSKFFTFPINNLIHPGLTENHRISRFFVLCSAVFCPLRVLYSKMHYRFLFLDDFQHTVLRSLNSETFIYVFAGQSDFFQWLINFADALLMFPTFTNMK